MQRSDALKTAATMIVINAFGGLWMGHMYLIGHYNSIKVRVAVCSLIYRKVSCCSFFCFLLLFNKQQVQV